MGLKTLNIELYNQFRSYFPGQNVTGRVILTLKKEKKIEGLTIRLVGKSLVRFTETVTETKQTGKGRKDDRKLVVYQNEEEYFNYHLNLIGNVKSKILVPPGTTTYSFNFLLPTNGLPSSYVGKSGQVFYQLEAKLTMKSAEQELITKVPFTVNGILDLNKELGVLKAAELRKYKYLCCFCCKSGPIGFVFQISKTGFVPGEHMKFITEVNNQSNRKIKGITITLMQTVHFHAKGNSTKEIRALRKVKGPQIEAGSDDTWNDFLQIPPIPPTKLACCNIIDVQYFLQIEMDLSGMAVNLKGDIPIIIGTIPLRRDFNLLTQRRATISTECFRENSETEYRDIQPVATAPFLDYPDLPPPTYSEAMNALPKEKEENMARKLGNISTSTPFNNNFEYEVDLSFTPVYVTYG